MTSILIDIRRDSLAGPAAVRGRLTATRIAVTRDGDRIVYPDVLTFALPGPVALSPAEPGDAWVLRLQPDGFPETVRVVRFTGPTVTWAALTDVDPATLNPAAPGVIPAWEALLDEIDALLNGYDLSELQDAPDFTLLFENGLI